MTVDTLTEDHRWTNIGLDGLAETACRQALTHLGLNPDQFEISLLGCNDARIAALNADFRGKPQPTNVLSWPAEDRAASSPGGRPNLPRPSASGPPQELGDIAIAYDTCAREARDAGKPLTDHATHLLVHGVLHLLGYDHIRDEDAAVMQRLEAGILALMGQPDPYRED
ncbi:MAG: rRNA maturation RNase YbeY [Paracoccaceae bacterium]